MIWLDLAQGSVPWLEARIGIPTASQFHRIITPRTGKLSEQSTGYRHELLAEMLLGVSLAEEATQFMERGSALEPEALSYYELVRAADLQPGGFFLRDDRRAGCSPDGLIGADGLLEIKCPSPAVHVGYLLEAGGDKYRPQMQGQLWIAEREWVDFLSYHPVLQPALVRCHRDQAYIAQLAAAVDEFCDRLAAAQEELAARGIVPTREASPVAAP